MRLRRNVWHLYIDMKPQLDARSLVFIIDDDLAMRDSMEFLLRSVGQEMEVFASASDFLQKELPDVPACLGGRHPVAGS
jgi:hypothetical protein